MTFPFRAARWTGVLLALTACATEPVVPSSRVDLAPSFSQDKLASGVDTVRWWERFGDATLNQLVSQAAQTNYDIRIGLARVQQAQAGTDIAKAALWPSLALGLSTQQQSTDYSSAVKKTSVPDTDTTRFNGSVSWEVDLFGGNRLAAQAVAKDAQAAAYGLAGTQLLVVSETARQYVIWQSQRERLALAEAIRKSYQHALDLTDRRLKQGLASPAELYRAGIQLKGFDANLPNLRGAITATENRLAGLLGSASALPQLASAKAMNWPSVQPLPAGQPAELLLRRPDLLAAASTLEAESARLGYAKTNRYPKLFLSALFGWQDLSLNGTALPRARFDSVGAGFSLPLFAGGRIEASIEAQQAGEKAALLSYEKAIVGALEDVENSLVAMNQGQARFELYAQQRQQHELLWQQALSLYKNGQIDALTLGEAERAWLSSRLTMTEQHASRMLEAIQLYKALGGGWKELPMPVVDKTKSAEQTPAPVVQLGLTNKVK